MTPLSLPPTIKVIVRDWLNANHVLLAGRDSAVLIDSAYCTHARRTLELLRAPGVLGQRPLDWLINTHCHTDHMGGNAALKRAYRCRLTLPQGDAELIDRRDDAALLLEYADQRMERFDYDDTIAPGDELRLGDTTWQALAAPGHAMGALVLYDPEHRVLISGDALWENGFGVVVPSEGAGQPALEAARATLERVSALDVAVVIPGHGAPFGDVGAALDRAFKRADAFAADPLRMARNLVKSCFVFMLLDRGSFPLEQLPDYLGRIGLYRDANAKFFKLAPAEYAGMLVGELERAAAVKREAGLVLPL